MNRSPNEKRLFPFALLADAALFIYLFSEVAFEHSMVSRLGMLLFIGAVTVLMLVKKKIFFSWWMAAYALIILWSAAVTFVWAIGRSESLDMLKTLMINTFFFFFLFQYLVLQADMRRYSAMFVLAVTALITYSFVFELSSGFTDVRFGLAVGINPNWMGMLAAVAFGLSLVLAKQKSCFWLLPNLVLLPAVVLSKSMKAVALAALLFIGVFLILYPKRWKLKLAVLLVVLPGAAFLLLYWDNFLTNGVLHRYHAILNSALDGDWLEGSFRERDKLLNVAMEAFRGRPATGWGLDCFRLLDGAKGTYTHCNYTELLVSGGVPLLALYYVPQLAALGFAGRSIQRRKKDVCSDECKRDRTLASVFMVLLAAQIVMDAGMVSYYDRTAAVFFILLVAAVRILQNKPGDGETFVKFIQNPHKGFSVLAKHGWFSRMDDETYLKKLYRARLGKKLNLDPPVTINEKIQWLKLHDRNPEHVKLVDKAAVRDFVAETIGCEYLVPLLGKWENPDDIDFEKLPERFVLKCTHNSGGVILCADKRRLDIASAKKKLKKLLKQDYYKLYREWLYKDVPRCVLAEEYIGAADGTPPDDYKFFCFDGIVRAICVCTNRSGKHADYYFFTPEFEPLPVNEATVNMPKDATVKQPERLDEMIALSEKLSAGMKHVRVDLYDTADGVRFGEVTFFDQSGFADDYVGDGDRIMGEFITLEEQA